MAEYVVFDDIPVGRKFKTSTGITYFKFSKKECKAIKDAKGNVLEVQKVTSTFYNSKMKMVLL